MLSEAILENLENIIARDREMQQIAILYLLQITFYGRISCITFQIQLEDSVWGYFKSKKIIMDVPTYLFNYSLLIKCYFKSKQIILDVFIFLLNGSVVT